MATTETISAQITCDFNRDCTNTVLIQRGGIQKVRRYAADSCDWLITSEADICPNHTNSYLRKKMAKNAAR